MDIEIIDLNTTYAEQIKIDIRYKVGAVQNKTLINSQQTGTFYFIKHFDIITGLANSFHIHISIGIHFTGIKKIKHGQQLNAI